MLVQSLQQDILAVTSQVNGILLSFS